MNMARGDSKVNIKELFENVIGIIEDRFTNHLEERDFRFTAAPVFDGKLHRAQVGDGKNLNGWFIGHVDGAPILIGGDWSGGENFKFFGGDPDKKLTRAEREEIDKRVKEANSKRVLERKRLQAIAAQQAAEEWSKALPAPENHKYLVDKKVKSHGLRVGACGALLVPVYDENMSISSLQRILPDGKKMFKTDGAIAGKYFPIAGDLSTVYIAEGYATGATVHEVTGKTVIVAFNAGNLLPVSKAIRNKYPDFKIVICGDDDRWKPELGNPGVLKATAAGAAINARVVFPQFKDVSSKPTDFNDLFVLEGPEVVRDQLRNNQSQKTESRPKYVGMEIGDFLQHSFPPRENILAPWLPQQGLVMVYAFRGVGKTHFALGVGYATCSGGSFLGWMAPGPVGVLYIDGEMPGAVMQERLAELVANAPTEPVAPFVIITPDLQPEGMPRIDTEEGQGAIEGFITDQIKLIIIDNLSTLSGAKENEADGWTPVQGWALRQRSQGRSVLFIHHSNKTGSQRGTSRREDVLDTVIALRRPAVYSPEQGAVFEVHFEKARGLYGDDVKPIEATLTTDEHGRTAWATRTVEDSTFDRVVELLNEGVSQVDIATELGIHKSNVSRHARKAQAAGLVETKKQKKGGRHE